ncbi:claudin-19 isoform X4 [Oncorhynchus kisutch]|uniref:claudin-19 isoform X4 n=1 Tax=Oncorhynchus kisutch TaxID=8019 RepID=UPI00099F92CF|nr:claudin-19 isoform X4 [Oncorhynchus kisutch]
MNTSLIISCLYPTHRNPVFPHAPVHVQPLLLPPHGGQHSGAIMTVLTAVCTKMPEAKLAIIFLPIYAFSAGNALKAIVVMDTAGLVLGWRYFDHAAHLGGALFGVQPSGRTTMLLAFQILGLSLGVIGWCLENSCTSSHSWRVRSHSGAVTTNNWQFEGLWMTCAATSLGSVQCQRYKTVLGLPERDIKRVLSNLNILRRHQWQTPMAGYIQACRALMIIALLLGLASVIVSVLGLKCTKIGSTSEQAKGKIALTGGSLFILSGLSTLTAVSWYAARVVQEFHDPFFAGVRFELGAGLYMGWGAACLAILGGVMLCCSCKRGPSGPTTGGYSYNYSKTSGGQQIYRAPHVSESGSSKAYV